jgi:hypothetical protein
VAEPTETPETEEVEVQTTEALETPETPELEKEMVVEGGEHANKASLSEAMDAAISDASRSRRITPKAELTPEQKEAAEKEAAEKTAKEDSEAAERGQLRDAKTGKFREMTAEEKKAHEDKKAADAAKAAEDEDPTTAPIPKELNERTAKRMQKLIDTVKAQSALVEQHDALFGMIQGTGASPDEFAQMVTYMKAAHTNDPKAMDAAYNLLKGELRALCLRMGKPIPEVNLLREAGNEDLIAEIREGKITVNRAHEIAVGRAAGKATTDTRMATATAEQQRTADARASADGKVALDKLGDELVKKDGAAVYAAKEKILIKLLQPLFAKLDPKAWTDVFRSHYDNLELAAPPKPTPKPASPGGGGQPANRPQPQRPKSPAGGGSTKVAGTALDAINQALEGV